MVAIFTASGATGFDLKGLTFGNNQFFAIGQSGKLIKSGIVK